MSNTGQSGSGSELAAELVRPFALLEASHDAVKARLAFGDPDTYIDQLSMIAGEGDAKEVESIRVVGPWIPENDEVFGFATLRLITQYRKSHPVVSRQPSLQETVTLEVKGEHKPLVPSLGGIIIRPAVLGSIERHRGGFIYHQITLPGEGAADRQKRAQPDSSAAEAFYNRIEKVIEATKQV